MNTGIAVITVHMSKTISIAIIVVVFSIIGLAIAIPILTITTFLLGTNFSHTIDLHTAVLCKLHTFIRAPGKLTSSIWSAETDVASLNLVEIGKVSTTQVQ